MRYYISLFLTLLIQKITRLSAKEHLCNRFIYQLNLVVNSKLFMPFEIYSYLQNCQFLCRINSKNVPITNLSHESHLIFSTSFSTNCSSFVSPAINPDTTSYNIELVRILIDIFCWCSLFLILSFCFLLTFRKEAAISSQYKLLSSLQIQTLIWYSQGLDGSGRQLTKQVN